MSLFDLCVVVTFTENWHSPHETNEFVVMKKILVILFLLPLTLSAQIKNSYIKVLTVDEAGKVLPDCFLEVSYAGIMGMSRQSTDAAGKCTFLALTNFVSITAKRNGYNATYTDLMRLDSIADGDTISRVIALRKYVSVKNDPADFSFDLAYCMGKLTDFGDTIDLVTNPIITIDPDKVHSKISAAENGFYSVHITGGKAVHDQKIQIKPDGIGKVILIYGSEKRKYLLKRIKIEGGMIYRLTKY